MGYLDQCELLHLKNDLALQPLSWQEREVLELLLTTSEPGELVDVPFSRDAAAARLVKLNLATYDEWEDGVHECPECGAERTSSGEPVVEHDKIAATELLIELRDRRQLGEIGL